MSEQTRFFSNKTSRETLQMGIDYDVKKSRVAKMLNETFSADEFENGLKKALITLHNNE